MTYCRKHSIRDYCKKGWRRKPDKYYERSAPTKLVHRIPNMICLMHGSITDRAPGHLPWWGFRPRVSFRDITCWHLPPNWPQLFVVSLNGSSAIFLGQLEYNPPKGQLASSHFISPGVKGLLINQLQYCNWPHKILLRLWTCAAILRNRLQSKYWEHDDAQILSKAKSFRIGV